MKNVHLILCSYVHRLHLCTVFAPRWLGQSSLAGHSVSDSAAVLCGPTGKPVGASSYGQGEGLISTLWLLGTVQCSCLLVPPLWSAGEASSVSVAAGVCYVA